MMCAKDKIGMQKNKIKYWICGMLFLMLACISFIGCGKSEAKLSDGSYLAEVTLSGGSGRASVESPTFVEQIDGMLYATIIWSSPNYDYMLVDGTKYLNEAEVGENSKFTIPIAGLGVEISCIADTTAMSVPHEIEYTLIFTQKEVAYEDILWEENSKISYAKEFTIQKSEQYALLTIVDSGRFLLVMDGAAIPQNVPADITILRQPLDNTYLVSSSVVDLIRQIDGLSNVKLIGIKEENLYIEDAVLALQNGQMKYAGKYNTPDYELILSEGCNLAIENTMIYHNPEVKEKLEELHIPVLVERSSYESHPFGRLEWIKLYGLLFGKEEEANVFFDSEMERVSTILNKEKNGCTVAYFFLNSNGVVNVRKPNDYIANMIALSGGEYVLADMQVEEENALSTMNMQMEDFYMAAKDADVLIYNSTIDGELETMADLIAKNELFSDFGAVKNGRVYCTSKDFFQETTGLGKFLEDLYAVETGDEQKDYFYLKHLE